MFEVIKPLDNYCNRDWEVGDLLIYFGGAYENRLWTENQDADDKVYVNKRTGQWINSQLIYDKLDYFKYHKNEKD